MEIGLPTRQNYRCHYCKRPSVERQPNPTFEREELLESLLLERVSWRAIAHILKVSLGWVVKRAKRCWQMVREELAKGQLHNPELTLYCLEADEMWPPWQRTFVGAKDYPVWLWLAVERRTGLVLGFHLGNRNEADAARKAL